MAAVSDKIHYQKKSADQKLRVRSGGPTSLEYFWIWLLEKLWSRVKGIASWFAY